mmetsp:Transcript_15465/g.20418  ORF Transcript_15465/g.20418 Transcript_15465/m.20418 type:complete len:137 (+) Transcript_15465:471-881(+)
MTSRNQLRRSVLFVIKQSVVRFTMWMATKYIPNALKSIKLPRLRNVWNAESLLRKLKDGSVVNIIRKRQVQFIRNVSKSIAKPQQQSAFTATTQFVKYLGNFVGCIMRLVKTMTIVTWNALMIIRKNETVTYVNGW